MGKGAPRVPRKFRRGRSRMARRLVPVRYAFVGMFAVAILASAVASLAGLSWEATLGVTGLAFGMMAPVVSEYRHLAGEDRRIVFIGSSRSSFTDNIARGVEAGLRGKLSYEFIDMRPSSEDTSALAFQIRALREPATLTADAVVIRPAVDDPELWLELQGLRRRGVFIVAIDVKPPNRFFYEDDVAMPRFVCSDFAAGGEMVGDELCRRSEGGDGVIVLAGPPDIPPSLIRSVRACYRLFKDRRDCPVVVRELEDFDPDAAVDQVLGAIEELDRLRGRLAERIVVFAGNDKVALALSRRLVIDRSLAPRSVSIIGYDGIRGADDVLVAQSTPFVVATVDTLPRYQGLQAAEFLVSEFFGHAAKVRKNAVVKPRLHTVDAGWA
jgi:ABC-type sugar transport system substrate-binding protein